MSFNEETHRLQTNHLGTAMLAFLLLPYLVKTAEITAKESNPTIPRIVVVSSETHFWTEINSEERQSPNILGKLNDSKYCDDRQ